LDWVGTFTNLGRTPVGTLTLAYMFPSSSLLCSLTAMLRTLLEMKGNGCETSRARGVSSACSLSL